MVLLRSKGAQLSGQVAGKHIQATLYQVWIKRIGGYDKVDNSCSTCGGGTVCGLLIQCGLLKWEGNKLNIVRRMKNFTGCTK